MPEKPRKHLKPEAKGADAPGWTPGTWTVERGNVGADHPLFVVSADGRSLRPWCDADAHLIAAAKGLYATLKRTRLRMLRYGEVQSEIDEIDAALAKADGQEDKQDG